MSKVTRYALIGGGAIIAAVAVSWLGTLLGFFGPGAVKESWKESYESYAALQNIARNSCTYEKMRDDAKNGSDPSTINQRETQLAVQKQLYSTEQGKYDAAVRNPLNRGLNKPADLPPKAPTLEEMTSKVCSK